MKKVIFLILLVSLISACSTQDFVEIVTTDDIITVNVEIADSDKEREEGLMFRDSLDYDSGMLFVYEGEEEKVFWMKNTLIPLDIIFIDSEGLIIKISSAVPCLEDPCTLYPSNQPAQYVLEVNSGFADDNGIRTGDAVII